MRPFLRAPFTSLRTGLLVLYCVMALLPTLLAGIMFMLYMRTQLDRLGTDYQHRALRLTETSQRKLREASEQTIQETFLQIQSNQRRFMSLHTNESTHQQERLLRQAFSKLDRAVQQNTEHTQQRIKKRVKVIGGSLQETLLKQQHRATERLTSQVQRAIRGTMATLVSQNALQLTRSLSYQVEEFFNHAISMLTLVAQQPAVQTFRDPESRWILESLQRREPSYQMLALLDAEDHPKQVVTDHPSLGEVAKRFFSEAGAHSRTFQAHINPELVLMPKRVPADAQTSSRYPLLAISVPIRIRGNKVQGTVFALLSLERIAHLVQALRIGKQSYTLLCTEEGMILAHRDLLKIGSKDIEHRELLERTLREGIQTALEVEGRSMLVATLPLRLQACKCHTLTWVMASVQPTSEAYALAIHLNTELQRAAEENNRTTVASMQQATYSAQEAFLSEVETHKQSLRVNLKHLFTEAQSQVRDQTQRLARQQVQEASRTLQEGTKQAAAALRTALAREGSAEYRYMKEALLPLVQTVLPTFEQRLLLAFLLALGLILLMSLVGGWKINHSLIKPIQRLAKATHAVTTGDLSQRVVIPGGCELARLAHAFNQMVEALDQSRRELQQAQAQLVQSAKMASLGTLASGVAHELNQPLAIIRALAQQNLNALKNLQEKMASEPSTAPDFLTTLPEDLHLIEQQTGRMMRIIQHLRTFARKSGGEEFEAVDLNEVAQNALILLREQLRNRNITLEEHYATDLPPVQGDANALEQVLLNLITNARDALEDRSDAKIIITTRTIQEGEQLWVEVSVADNGIGIPPEIQSQIFDPFFTTKEAGKGTGLGLSISFDILQKHHGILQLVSTPNEGTTFFVRLPASQSAQAAA